METVNGNNLPQAIKDTPANELQPLSASTLKERERTTTPSLSLLQDLWRRLKKNKAVAISMSFSMVIIFISIITTWVSPHNPTKQNAPYINLSPRVPGLESASGLNGKTTIAGQLVDKYVQANVPDSVNFYLGTDGLGRDVLSRLLIRTRISLLIAFAAVILDITIGATYGLISGLVGGRVDTVMQRILEALSDIPSLAVMILILAVFDPGAVPIVLAMVITSWISMARIVRTQTIKLKGQESIMTAKTLGESCWEIAIKHILPGISSVIIVRMMFSISSAALFEAFLDFIGLGSRPPTASLETLLNEGYKTFRLLPYLTRIPTAALLVITVCFNLLVDGLRDVFDPKMEG